MSEDNAAFVQGTRVRLHPGRAGRGGRARRRTDAQDMFCEGRLATIQKTVDDVSGETFLAVTLDDDPAAELNDWYGRYHYFTPAEVEVIGDGTA